jgi:hypothetical protein
MPYLSSDVCEANNIFPGAILEGDFSPSESISEPHVEDHDYNGINFIEPASTEEFKKALNFSLVPSIESGFNVTLGDKQKHIEKLQRPIRSIVTIAVAPNKIKIVQSDFDPEKLKISLTDGSGKYFGYLSITDLGFHEYARKNNTKTGIERINRFIQTQDKIFLRIGLSRIHEAKDGRVGYWVQVNGVYTFPEYLKEIRCYR